MKIVYQEGKEKEKVLITLSDGVFCREFFCFGTNEEKAKKTLK